MTAINAFAIAEQGTKNKSQGYQLGRDQPNTSWGMSSSLGNNKKKGITVVDTGLYRLLSKWNNDKLDKTGSDNHLIRTDSLQCPLMIF